MQRDVNESAYIVNSKCKNINDARKTFNERDAAVCHLNIEWCDAVLPL